MGMSMIAGRRRGKVSRSPPRDAAAQEANSSAGEAFGRRHSAVVPARAQGGVAIGDAVAAVTSAVVDAGVVLVVAAVPACIVGVDRDAVMGLPAAGDRAGRAAARAGRHGTGQDRSSGTGRGAGLGRRDERRPAPGRH